MDKEAEEDIRKDGLIWSNTTWNSYDSCQRTQRIVVNEEGPVWLTPHLRDT